MLFNIQKLIPHRSPMILLDEVLSANEEGARCRVKIREESLFFEKGSVPIWIGMEYMAQCVAVFGGHYSLAESQNVGIGFLLGTRKYKAHVESFALGQELIIEAKLNLRDEMLSNFDCKIFCNSNLLVEASLTTYKPNSEMLEKLKKGDILVV